MFNLLLKTEAFDFAKIFSNIGKQWYYYLALIIVVALLVFFSFKGKKKRNNLTGTQKIAYIAVLTALAVIANSPICTIHISDMLQISLVASVGFIAGYLLGAIGGFAVSFIGDLICGIIMPFGAYNPIIGIGTGLWGFIPGIIFTCFKGNAYVKTVISFAICFVFNSFALNTLGLSLMYSISFDKLLVALPIKLVVVAINSVISCLFVALLPRILPKNKFNI